MAIGEICSREVVFVAQNESCAQAARLMRENHVGSLVVLQADVVPRIPVGMITDRDLTVGVMALGRLVGVIAADDLIDLFAEELSGLAAMLSKAPRHERAERRAVL